MQASGREVAEVLSRRKGQHQRAEDLRRAVERRLRLRRLSHDPTVSHDRCTPGFRHVKPKLSVESDHARSHRKEGNLCPMSSKCALVSAFLLRTALQSSVEEV